MLNILNIQDSEIYVCSSTLVAPTQRRRSTTTLTIVITTTAQQMLRYHCKLNTVFTFSLEKGEHAQALSPQF